MEGIELCALSNAVDQIIKKFISQKQFKYLSVLIIAVIGGESLDIGAKWHFD